MLFHLNLRYYDRSGESYSGSSDEFNFSDPQQYYQDEFRSRTYYNSHPPRRKFSPNLSARQSKQSKRHYRSEELIGDERDFFIVVRGGIYEVDLQEWKCNSIYWPGPGLEIMRGTWFHDTSWQPVECEHADRIEAEHIKRFLGHKMADYVWDAKTSMRREIQVRTALVTRYRETLPKMIKIIGKYLPRPGPAVGFAKYLFCHIIEGRAVPIGLSTFYTYLHTSSIESYHQQRKKTYIPQTIRI